MLKKVKQSPFLREYLGRLVALVYRVLASTWRIREYNKPSDSILDRCILAHWHGDELAVIGPYRDKGVVIMVSPSSDGQLMKVAAESLGYRTVKGSSSRGGVRALKGAIDFLTQQQSAVASVAVDGPKGPRFQVKPGVVSLAQWSGLPVVYAVAVAKNKYVFKKSWNQCFLPFPFSVIEIHYGTPLYIPQQLDKSQRENYRMTLQARMCELHERQQTTHSA